MRSGRNTEVFRTIERDDIPEDCAFSIIHGDNFIVLDLIANSPDDANIWITGLRCLLDSDFSKLALPKMLQDLQGPHFLATCLSYDFLPTFDLRLVLAEAILCFLKYS